MRLARALFGVEVLAYALWLGGMVAIALTAPVVFQVVPSRDLAGRVFGGVLARLFPLIYVCGALILVAGAVHVARARALTRSSLARYGLVAVMLAVAVYTGVVVLGEMQTIQAALPGPIESLPLDAGARARFDSLHKLSERLMGLDVVLALLLLPLLLSRREPAA
jgi:formate hydrogenlyase subunit 4